MALNLFELIQVLFRSPLQEGCTVKLEDSHRVRDTVVEGQGVPDSSQLETRTIPFFPGRFVFRRSHASVKYTWLTGMTMPRLARVEEESRIRRAGRFPYESGGIAY